MLSRKIAIGSGVGIMLVGLLFMAGCYDTKTPLGSASSGTVDPANVGDFAIVPAADALPAPGAHPNIFIRNFDDKMYCISWTGDDGKTSLWAGYTTQVKDAMFANCRQLTDDGSLSDDFFIMRIAFSADHSQLTVRNLKDDFFKGQDVSSSDKLQSVIADNLDNNAMYDSDTLYAHRVAATTQPAQ
ncbi:MAG: hypothetical protein ABSG31_08600 [Tepidisphaeraceae bacterium]|jgi:hypothetical protein